MFAYVAKIQMNSAGAAALLKSGAVIADLQQRGEAISNAAGGSPDFIVKATVRKNRAHVSVVTATRKARKAEADERRLSTSLDAGR